MDGEVNWNRDWQKNDDIHRGCCSNGDLKEAGKVTWHCDSDGGVFGRTTTTIVMTKTEGGY